MEKIKITILTFRILLCCACDSDKNKVKIKEVTDMFVSAINAKDKATIYSIYPNAKNINNMSLPDSIQKGDITIEKNDSVSYIVSIANARMQKLVFEVKSENEVVLNDTYSVLELDSASLELAIQTGVPVKEISDLNVSKLLDVEGDYIEFLKKTHADEIQGSLVRENGTWTAQRAYGGNVTVTQAIRNVGTVPIKGSEYNVEFTFYSPNGTSNAHLKKVENGVDLEPNEATTFYLYPGNGYVEACYEHDFNWNVSFVYKNQPPISSLLNKAKLKGTEYEEYVKSKESDETKHGTDSKNPYAWLKERLATENDLIGRTKEDIKIMRNTIFAMHGYIFKSQDVKEYFSKKSWYKPQKEDVNSELSAIENKNIQFLKSHE